MSRNTIYDYAPFDMEEQYLLLMPSSEIYRQRWSEKVGIAHIDDFVTQEEYMSGKTDKEKYYDLFLLCRHRGWFKRARKYEKLADHDAIKWFENLPSDMFLKNEVEYYEWRKKNQ